MAVDTSSLAGTDNKKGYPKDQDIEEFASKEEVACPSRERERGGGMRKGGWRQKIVHAPKTITRDASCTPECVTTYSNADLACGCACVHA